MLIIKVIGFICKIMKFMKIAKTIFTMIDLTSTCSGTNNTINMVTKKGVNVTITVWKDEPNIDEDTKAIEEKENDKLEQK